MRRPPQDTPAERAVLGAMLMNPDAVSKAIRILGEPADDLFFLKEHNGIYAAVYAMHGEGVPVDVVTLATELERAGHLFDGGATLIGQLLQAVPTSANVEHYAHAVTEAANRRRFMLLSFRMAEQAGNVNVPFPELLAQGREFINRLMSTPGRDLIPFADMSRYEEVAKQEHDWIFDGQLRRGIVGSIVAKGGTFKTTCAHALIVSAVTGKVLYPSFVPLRPLRVLACYAEDPEDVMCKRTVALQQAFPEKLSPDELKAALQDNALISCGHPLALVEQDGRAAKLTSRFGWFSGKVQEFKPDLIILDPLAKFYKAVQNDNDQGSLFMTALQELATDANATVLFTHHVSKASDGRLDAASARGAGAFTDEGKWTFNLRDEGNSTDGQCKRKEGERVIAAEVTKSNYSRLVGMRFQVRDMGDCAVLVDYCPERERLLRIAKLAAEYFRNNAPLTARSIEKEPEGKALHEFILKREAAVTRREIVEALSVGECEGLVKRAHEARGNNPSVEVWTA